MMRTALVTALLLAVSFSSPLNAGSRSSPTTQDQRQVLSFVRANGANLFLNERPLQLFGVNHADVIWSFIQPASIAENGKAVVEEAAK